MKERKSSSPESALDIMAIAEEVFDDTQLSNYYMVKSFIELCSMVTPENHKKVAMILEGLIAK